MQWVRNARHDSQVEILGRAPTQVAEIFLKVFEMHIIAPIMHDEPERAATMLFQDALTVYEDL